MSVQAPPWHRGRTRWLTILDLPNAGFDVIERQICDLLLERIEIQVHDGQYYMSGRRREQEEQRSKWKEYKLCGVRRHNYNACSSSQLWLATLATWQFARHVMRSMNIPEFSLTYATLATKMI